MLQRRGFTLVELLVVIAIIGLLVALLIPAVQYAREASRLSTCKSNLRQLGVALQEHHNKYRVFPPGVVNNRDHDFRSGRHSGFVYLLEDLDQPALYEAYNRRKNWDDPANRQVISATLEVLLCPSSGRGVPQDGGVSGGATDYAFSKGPLAYLCRKPAGLGMFDINSETRDADVVDGLSNTIAMGEAASSPSLEAFAP